MGAIAADVSFEEDEVGPWSSMEGRMALLSLDVVVVVVTIVVVLFCAGG